MTSSYMVDVKTEIAWNAGFADCCGVAHLD
jgi:hypothetical protein